MTVGGSPNLTTADIADSTGALTILESVRQRWPCVKHLFANATYNQVKLMGKAALLDSVIEVVRHMERFEDFKVLRRRWLVE